LGQNTARPPCRSAAVTVTAEEASGAWTMFMGVAAGRS
jgi:hypothetical protein